MDTVLSLDNQQDKAPFVRLQDGPMDALMVHGVRQ